jgi:hypothetical protein
VVFEGTKSHAKKEGFIEILTILSGHFRTQKKGALGKF